MLRTVLLTAAAVVLTASATLAQENLLGEFYGVGVHSYFAGDYKDAHDNFTAAIEGGTRDPRVYYFRGLSLVQLGRPEDATLDYEAGAKFEAEGEGERYPIGRSLQRIQGGSRLQIERTRQMARLNHKKESLAKAKQRYEQRQVIDEPTLDNTPTDAAIKAAELLDFGDGDGAPKDAASAPFGGDGTVGDAAVEVAPERPELGGPSEPDPFGDGGAAPEPDPFGDGGAPTEPDPFGGAGDGGAAPEPDPFGGAGDGGAATEPDPFGGAGDGGAAPQPDPFGGAPDAGPPVEGGAPDFGGGAPEFGGGGAPDFGGGAPMGPPNFKNVISNVGTAIAEGADDERDPFDDTDEPKAGPPAGGGFGPGPPAGGPGPDGPFGGAPPAEGPADGGPGGADPFGGAAPEPAGGDPFGGGAPAVEPAGGDPFGGDAPAPAGGDPFGGEAPAPEPAGGDPFGGGAAPAPAGGDPFGGGAPEMKEGDLDEDPFADDGGGDPFGG